MPHAFRRKFIKTIFMLCFVLFALMSINAPAFAGVANPAPKAQKQPDGTVIQVYTHGDEFLNWQEDAEGNLIVFDEALQGYCYASWTDTGPASTGELLTLFPAKTMMLQMLHAKGGDIPLRVRERAQQKRATSPAPAPAQLELTAGNTPVPTPAAQLQRRLLIIHVTWSNRTGIYNPKLNGQQIYNLVFNANSNSLNRYYKELIGATEDIVSPAAVKNPLDGAPGIIEVVMNGRHPGSENDEDTEDILEAAMIAACDQELIDLQTFDTNKDSYLEATELSIGFIVDGYEESAEDLEPGIWGLSTDYTPYKPDTNGVEIECYFAVGAFYDYPDAANGGLLTIGLICHEFGHAAYGFDDTYQYETSAGSSLSKGHGYWSLMSYGSWCSKTSDISSGYTPGYPDAYNLVKHGFVSPGTLNEGESATVTGPLDIYIAKTAVNDKQYFLLQPRKYGLTDNYDRGVFDSISNRTTESDGGLLIYHVDENVTLGVFNNNPGHYRAAIEEAHGGNQHLQQRNSLFSGSFMGDLDDLWGANKKEFSANSDPASSLYSDSAAGLEQNTPSGITVSNINWNAETQTTTFTWGKSVFVAVADIIGGPLVAKVQEPLTLSGEVFPPDATNKEIIWSIKDAGDSGATLSGNILNTTNAGTVTVTATVKNGQKAQIKALSAGQLYSLALKSNGSLWSWGYNRYGQLGNGVFIDSNIPAPMDTSKDWIAVTAGQQHTLAVKRDGSLWAWGDNTYGQLGAGATNFYNTPLPVGADKDWVSVMAGDAHTVGRKSDGSLWAWGWNLYGQVGDGSTKNRYSPVRVEADTVWTSVAVGGFHNLGLKSDGSLWAWGENDAGQLGDGTFTHRSLPVQVGTDRDWAAVAAGQFYSMALKSDGSLWAWGENIYGQFGAGTTSFYNTPLQVSTDKDWAAVAAGNAHTVALKKDGSLWAWGWNLYGQVGNGTTNNRYQPVRIGTDTNWISVVAGGFHNLGLKEDGSLWAWGYNIYGQLGNGTNTNGLTPAQILPPPDYEDFTKDFTIRVTTGQETAAYSGTILCQSSPVLTTVTLSDSNSGVIATATNGAYTFFAPPGPGYTLTVTKPGYLTYTVKNLTLTAGDDIETIDMRQLAGDINGDGVVNATDLTYLLSEFNRKPVLYTNADIDGNGIVNATDLTYLLAGFNKHDVEIIM